MKNKFKKSVFLLSSLMMLSVGAGVISAYSNDTVNVAEAAETIYSYTFPAKTFSANGEKSLGDVKWTLAGDGGYWGFDNTKGQQFGSGSLPYKSLTLTSENFEKVSEIEINTSGASSTNATFEVSVGGTKVGSPTKLTTTATGYTFTPVNLSGAVVFSYTQTSSKAIYIKSIKITYDGEDGSTSEPKPVINEPAIIETTIEDLVTNVPTDYSLKQSYQVTGIWTVNSDSNGSKYGNGTLKDENNNSITIYGMAKSKDLILNWNSETGLYKNITSTTYSELGLSSGDKITLGVVYNSTYKNYYSYFISKAEVTYEYAITFDAGSNGTCKTTSSGSNGEVTMPDVTANEGFEFVGWYVSTDETKLYNAGEKVTITEDTTFVAKYQKVEVPATKYYQANLVTNVAELKEGDEIVIVGTHNDDKYVMSTNQKDNNRGSISFTENFDSVTLNEEGYKTQVITLKEGNKDGTFAFNVGTGYLYAASSSSNNLKTGTTLSDNSSWSITIDDNSVTSIVAQGTYTRSTMKFNYNNGSPLFACYASSSTTGVTVEIYKLSSTSINRQYDNDTDPTAIRLIGTINNININDIETISLVLTKNDEEVTVEIKTVYTSISGTNFTNKIGTYYVVYVLKGLNTKDDEGNYKYRGQSFNAKMVVSLVGDSVIEAKTGTFTLGE